MFSLKDLKLNDLIKIALTATAIIALTFNLSIMSHNTTIINNYIEKTTEQLDTLQKSSDEQQANITKVQEDINKTILITEEILEEVD